MVVWWEGMNFTRDNKRNIGARKAVSFYRGSTAKMVGGKNKNYAGKSHILCGIVYVECNIVSSICSTKNTSFLIFR